MAEVEKLNINSTDYDIADAKALRNKDTVTGEGTFIDTRAGNQSYPTTGGSSVHTTVVGSGAAMSDNANNYVTIYGDQAHTFGSSATALGQNAEAFNLATATGVNSVASLRAVATGSAAKAKAEYSIANGVQATVETSANYSIATGSQAQVGSGSTYSIAHGASSSVGTSVTRGTAVGANATVSANNAMQLGQGTNSSEGTLQFRSWPVIGGNGKLVSDRLPDQVIQSTDTISNPYNTQGSYIDFNDVVIYYTGPDKGSYKHNTFYKGVEQVSGPKFVVNDYDGSYISSAEDIQIDQNVLFQKFVDISESRINNNDEENAIIGGAEGNMLCSFFYNPSDLNWMVQFGNFSFDSGFNVEPNTYYFSSGETLEDFGITINNLELPSSETECVFSVNYRAPNTSIYWIINNDRSYVEYIDYKKFMDFMAADDSRSFKAVLGHAPEYWTYGPTGANTYKMPVIPKSYTYNGSTWDKIIVTFAYDNNSGDWLVYFNNDMDSGFYVYTTAELEQYFGIHIQSGYEGQLLYMEFWFQPSVQKQWIKANPAGGGGGGGGSVVDENGDLYISDDHAIDGDDEQYPLIYRTKSQDDSNVIKINAPVEIIENPGGGSRSLRVSGTLTAKDTKVHSLTIDGTIRANGNIWMGRTNLQKDTLYYIDVQVGEDEYQRFYKQGQIDGVWEWYYGFFGTGYTASEWPSPNEDQLFNDIELTDPVGLIVNLGSQEVPGPWDGSKASIKEVKDICFKEDALTGIRHVGSITGKEWKICNNGAAELHSIKNRDDNWKIDGTGTFRGLGIHLTGGDNEIEGGLHVGGTLHLGRELDVGGTSHFYRDIKLMDYTDAQGNSRVARIYPENDNESTLGTLQHRFSKIFVNEVDLGSEEGIITNKNGRLEILADKYQYPINITYNGTVYNYNNTTTTTKYFLYDGTYGDIRPVVLTPTYCQWVGGADEVEYYTPNPYPNVLDTLYSDDTLTTPAGQIISITYDSFSVFEWSDSNNNSVFSTARGLSVHDEIYDNINCIYNGSDHMYVEDAEYVYAKSISFGSNSIDLAIRDSSGYVIGSCNLTAAKLNALEALLNNS